MNNLIYVVGAFLLIIGIIDWKVRKIPSIFLTGFLFAVAIITKSLSPNALTIGLLGLTMALLMYEGGFIGGIADIKVIGLISFMIVNPYWLLASFLLIGVYGLAWKSIIKIRLNKETECAFLPVFFFVFVTLVMVGGIL